MRSWNQALALAPLVLGVVACSGDGTPETDAGQAANDSGVVLADAGAQSDSGTIADAGLADAAVQDGGAAIDAGTPADAGNTGVCTYPEGAVEPMALDAVITPYSWPVAIDGAGTARELDLTKVHCANDDDIDWSPFDVLVFVSIPAW